MVVDGKNENAATVVGMDHQYAQCVDIKSFTKAFP